MPNPYQQIESTNVAASTKDEDARIAEKAAHEKNRTIANNVSRCLEPAKSLGAGAHAGYCAYSLDDAGKGNDQITADIIVANAVGNFSGLILGGLLHFIVRKHYRVGSHQLFWIKDDPERDFKATQKLIRKLKVTANAAFVRCGNKLYYYNKAIKGVSELELSAENFESNFGSYFSGMHEGDKGRLLDDVEKEKLRRQVRKEHPDYIESNSRTSPNPVYRNYKNLSALGFQFGQAANAITNVAGIENPGMRRLVSFIFSDVCCLTFGSFALLYWVGREKLMKVQPNEHPEIFITGTEGISKPTKTGLTFGTAVGQGIGGITAVGMHATSSAISYSINLWGGLVGVAGFFFTLLVVPTVNWVSSKFTKDGKGILTAEIWDLGLLELDDADKVPTEEQLRILSESYKEAAILVKQNNELFFYACYRTRWQMIRVTEPQFGTKEIQAFKNLPFQKRLLTKKSPELTKSIITSMKKIHVAALDKDKFRNNYPRSGMVLGAGIGALIGLFVGQWYFGIVLCSLIFSAIGTAVGAVMLTVFGSDIHKKLHPKGETNDIENSWDYVSRSCANVFGFFGAAVVCLINPAAALLLAPVGIAIASLVGWVVGLLAMRQIRNVKEVDPKTGKVIYDHKIELKASVLPWTQRITTGANIGAAIGGVIGIGIGLLGFVFTGPGSLILAVSLFSAVGALAGGVVGVLWDDNGRRALWAGVKSFFARTPKIVSGEKLPPVNEMSYAPTPTNKLPVENNSSSSPSSTEDIASSLISKASPVLPHSSSLDSIAEGNEAQPLRVNGKLPVDFMLLPPPSSVAHNNSVPPQNSSITQSFNHV